MPQSPYDKLPDISERLLHAVDGVAITMNRFRHFRFVLLTAVLTTQCIYRVEAQSIEQPKRAAIGIITSYFGTHPQLQRAALMVAEDVSKDISNTDAIDVIPFELSAGESSVWHPKQSQFSFQQAPLSPKPVGHDNEAAVRYLAKKYDSFVLISNGPSVAPRGKLSGGSMPKEVWQRRLSVPGSTSELLIIGSENVPQTIVDSLTLTANPPVSQQLGRKATETKDLSPEKSDGPWLIIGLAMVAMLALQILAHIRTLSLNAKFERLSKRLLDGNLATINSFSVLEQSYDSIHTAVLMNRNAINQVVETLNHGDHSPDATPMYALANFPELDAAIVEINRVSQSMKPILELQEKSYGAISDMIVGENAKLKQSLAESRADVKRFDETVLTYAKLLFRLKTDPLNDYAVRQNSEYVLGRLKRYFERAGVDIIMPVAGDELQDELHSVVGTEPANDQYGHMAIVSVDELGIRRGENVIEKAKVIVAVEESK